VGRRRRRRDHGRQPGRAGGRAGAPSGARGEVPKPAADPGWGQPPGWGGFLPGAAQVLGQGAGERSWVWAAINSQVHRSAACGVPIFGVVQPRVCLNSRKVCSRSNLRRKDCHHRSTSPAVAAVTEDHSQTGLGSRSPSKGSTCSRMRVPSMMGSSPSWSAQQPRCVSRGVAGPSWSRSRCRSGWWRWSWRAPARARSRAWPGQTPVRVCLGVRWCRVDARARWS
jgi:hypothetical protein